MEPIRVFVGTDQWQKQCLAEDVLEYSIRSQVYPKETPVEITFMRSGDPGWEITADGAGDTWAAGGAIAGGWVKAPGRTWGTPFSCFRFAVPELCDFEGYAIYRDADMLLLDNIVDLWQLRPRGAGYRSVSVARTDVSVIDCGWFKNQKWWPSIDEMKATRARVFEYVQLMQRHKAIDPGLPACWNDCDGEIFASPTPMCTPTKLLHYTTVPDGQPWRPYPNITYPKAFPYCRNIRAGLVWFDYLKEMLIDKHGEEEGTRILELQAHGTPEERAATAG